MTPDRRHHLSMKLLFIGMFFAATAGAAAQVAIPLGAGLLVAAVILITIGANL